MRIQIFVRGAFYLLAGMASSLAIAFNADGMVSGTTRDQLAANFVRLGLQVKNRADGTTLVSIPGALGQDALLGFCRNRLTSYRRNITSDSDYAATLYNLFRIYGPPGAINFQGKISTDMASGNGMMQSYVITQWWRSDDRVELKSYFDWRIEQRNLERFQPATLFYEMRNPCAW